MVCMIQGSFTVEGRDFSLLQKCADRPRCPHRTPTPSWYRGFCPLVCLVPRLRTCEAITERLHIPSWPGQGHTFTLLALEAIASQVSPFRRFVDLIYRQLFGFSGEWSVRPCTRTPIIQYLQQLRCGRSCAGWKSADIPSTVYVCIYKGVRLKSRIRHTGTRSGAALPPSRIALSPSSILPPPSNHSSFIPVR